MDNLQGELDELIRNRKQLPWRIPGAQEQVYKERRRVLEAQLRGLGKIAAAVKAGYEPYTPPEKWYGGFLEAVNPWDWTLPLSEGVGGLTGKTLEMRFSTPIPAEVLLKYQAAKRTGLFDQFLVVAPDPSLFETISSLFCEPAIVGYVGTEREKLGFASNREWQHNKGWIYHLPRFHVGNGTGFLIAMWDMEKDRQFAGLE